MRQVNETATQILAAPSRKLTLQADVFMGANRIMENVTCTGWNLSWDRDGQAKATGQVTLLLADDAGKSLAPFNENDPLAPSGTIIALRALLQVGESVEAVQLGQYPVADTPSIVETDTVTGGLRVVLNSTVEVKLTDLLGRLAFDGPLAPEQTREGTCWGEIARLSRLPVQRTLADKPCPTYTIELKPGGYLDVIQRIAQTLGGVLNTTPGGALTVFPSNPTKVAGMLTIGDGGTLFPAARAISVDNVKNCVVGIYETDDRQPIPVEPAQITDGVFAVDGAFGRRVFYDSDESVKTPEHARNRVDALLREKSQVTVERVFQAVIDPRMEIGDLWTLNYGTETVTGVVSSLRWGTDGTMQGTLTTVRQVANV